MKTALLVSIVVGLCCIVCNGLSPAPVIIVPGLSASALRWTNAKWYEPELDRAWVNLGELFDPDWAPHNYKKMLPVIYDAGNMTLQSKKSIKPYADLEGVINIAGNHSWELPGNGSFGEFYDLVRTIRAESTGVKAAPYDWRLVPSKPTMEAWASDMRSKIEVLYQHYGQRVFIVAHSLGNLMTLWFLNQVGSMWNEKFIAGYIGASPPYTGAGLGLAAVTFGFTEEELLFHKLNISKHIPATLLGNFGSFPWVFPRYSGIIVANWSHHNFPASELLEFMDQYHFNSSAPDIYRDIIYPFDFSIFNEIPPGLTVSQIHLIVSTYNYTETGIQWDGEGWKGIFEPKNATTEKYSIYGDGTVPHVSLHANDWLFGPPEVIPDCSHSDIIKHPRFLRLVTELIRNAAQHPGPL